MSMSKFVELTEKSIEYDQLLRRAWHLHGHEADLLKEEMEQLASVIQKLREEVAYIIARKTLNPYR